MTKPRYPQQDCAAGSKAHGDAAGVASHAFNANLNNGNVNNNHRNNSGFGLAVSRPGEFRGTVRLQALYLAMRRAQRSKQPSHNQARFMAHWIDRLIELEDRLNAGTWKPSPSTCFIATRPKAREIHAPDFGDRVMHHWLVPQLEAIYEPRFIHDSYGNRRGKGSHAAVRRARDFMRQVHSGQGGGWYLQLDIHNYFNSIHRPTLWALLKPTLQRARLPLPALMVTHALLRQPPLTAGVDLRATPAELALVPSHKRLANAAPGCGLPIGNLSSQFFANVYLDALDQFVKHQLKAKRYVRYVDDFVLFHHDRAQLVEWQQRIEAFLRDKLRLRLKPDIRLHRLDDGLDFLGYIIRPTHTRVRRRVIAHLHEALQTFKRSHIRGDRATGTPQDFERLRNVLASYGGHLNHANTHRLRACIRARYPWLSTCARNRRFHPRLLGRRITLRLSR